MGLRQNRALPIDDCDIAADRCAGKHVFSDGSSTDKVEVEYPIGHRRRRKEGIPVLQAKFAANVQSCFEPQQAEAIVKLLNLDEGLDEMPVSEFMTQLRRKP